MNETITVNCTECCRQTFVSWWAAGSSRDLPLPRLTATEFLLQTSRRTGLYWCTWSVGLDEHAVCL